MCQEFCPRRVSTPLHAGMNPSDQMQTPPQTRGRHPPGADTHTLGQCMLGNLGKEWAVRILLEYIIVLYCKFHWSRSCPTKSAILVLPRVCKKLWHVVLDKPQNRFIMQPLHCVPVCKDTYHPDENTAIKGVKPKLSDRFTTAPAAIKAFTHW